MPVPGQMKSGGAVRLQTAAATGAGPCEGAMKGKGSKGLLSSGEPVRYLTVELSAMDVDMAAQADVGGGGCGWHGYCRSFSFRLTRS